jgi:predicted acylesterase/phospholipase RssA
VCAANLTRATHEFFGIESCPEMPVLLAIRMSFGVPLLYTPVVHKGCVFVDGGLMCNCPIDFVESTELRGMHRNVLALELTLGGDPPAPLHASEDCPQICDYIWLLLRAMVLRANERRAQMQCAHVPPKIHVVHIPSSSEPCAATSDGCRAARCMFFSLDECKFRLSAELIQSLVQLGYDTMKADVAH